MVSALRPGEWYGRVDREARVGGLRLSLVHHDRPRAIEVHEHSLAYFCFLVAGSYAETHDGVTIEYEPFSIAFHPSRFAHSDEILAANSTFFAIELETAWEDRIGRRFDTSAWRFELQHGETVWLAVELLKAFLHDRLDDGFGADAIVAEMVGVALRVVDRDRPQRAWVAKVKQLLQERFTERVRLEDVAEFAGLHPASLARGFRVDEGITIGDYLSRLRVQHACRLMSNRTMSLADVAASCGFADQSHLTRTFKSITGMPPGLFRDDLRLSPSTT